MNTRETQIRFEVGLLVSNELAEAVDSSFLPPPFLQFTSLSNKRCGLKRGGLCGHRFVSP